MSPPLTLLHLPPYTHRAKALHEDCMNKEELQARQGNAFTRGKPHWLSGLRLSAYRIVENKFLLIKPSRDGIL